MPWSRAPATANASCSRRSNSQSPASMQVTMVIATKRVNPSAWVACWRVRQPHCRSKPSSAVNSSKRCLATDPTARARPADADHGHQRRTPWPFVEGRLVCAQPHQRLVGVGRAWQGARAGVRQAGHQGRDGAQAPERFCAQAPSSTSCANCEAALWTGCAAEMPSLAGRFVPVGPATTTGVPTPSEKLTPSRRTWPRNGAAAKPAPARSRGRGCRRR